MRHVIAGCLLGALLLGHAARAVPPAPSVAQWLEVCASATVAEATRRGDALGWRRMTEADTAAWRSAFLRVQGGTVEVVGWKRAERPDEASFSFWVATGRDAHTACTYSVADSAGLLDGLRAQLGAPDSLERTGDIVTAFWKAAGAEISYSQVGQQAGVSVSRR